MIKKFNEFISEDASDNNEHLLYYAFDWDDNILYMPTKIIGIDDKGVDVGISTEDFAKYRSLIGKENFEYNGHTIVGFSKDPFVEFRDAGPRGKNAFLEDAKLAISNKKFGPAWDDFVECLKNGSLFAIITARGHESDAMRLGVEWIIDNILTDNELYQMYNNLLKFAYLFKHDISEYDRILKGQPSKNKLVTKYLDECDFVGVSSPSRGGSPASPEKAKEETLMEFKDKINNFAKSLGVDAKIGFSDDDLKNVKHVEDLVGRLHNERFPNIKEIVVKGTKDPMNITKTVRRFEGIDPMQSSIIPFADFNNIITQSNGVTGNFSPGGSEDRQDTFGDRLKKQSKYLTKMSKDLLGKKSKKKD
jgi:hypothetical protein